MTWLVFNRSSIDKQLFLSKKFYLDKVFLIIKYMSAILCVKSFILYFFIF